MDASKVFEPFRYDRGRAVRDMVLAAMPGPVVMAVILAAIILGTS